MSISKTAMSFWGINEKADKLEHDLSNLKTLFEQLRAWIENEYYRSEREKSLFYVLYDEGDQKLVPEALAKLSECITSVSNMEKQAGKLLKSDKRILTTRKKNHEYISVDLKGQYQVLALLKEEYKKLFNAFHDMREIFFDKFYDAESHQEKQTGKKAHFFFKLEGYMEHILNRDSKLLREEGKYLEKLRSEIDTPYKVER